jgi:hypothetical protein
VPHHSTVLSPGELGHVGVLLLRHDRRPGAEAVWQADEAHARIHPQNQFFAQPRQMNHEQGAKGAELDREIAIRHGVQRVARDRREAKFARHPLAVDRKRRAGECGGAQREHVHARAAVGQRARSRSNISK